MFKSALIGVRVNDQRIHRTTYTSEGSPRRCKRLLVWFHVVYGHHAHAIGRHMREPPSIDARGHHLEMNDPRVVTTNRCHRAHGVCDTARPSIHLLDPW